jgi:hypothetical protein
MTQELNSLFEDQIARINACESSIFTKSDVMNILTATWNVARELPAQEPGSFTKQYILDTLEEVLNEFDYDELTTFEPELQGCYGSSWSLEINHSFDDHEFKRSLLIDLENYLIPAE